MTMANLLQRFRQLGRRGEVKANPPIPTGGSTNYAGDWRWSLRADLAGTKINYDKDLGDPWMESVIAAALAIITTTFPEARPCVKETGADGNETLLFDHPVAKLIRRPNPQYGYSRLMAGSLISWDTGSNFYWLKFRPDGDPTKPPTELWYVPHKRIEIVTEDNDSAPISYYRYTNKGKQYKVPPGEMVHVAYGIDPNDPRSGLAPLQAVKRERYTLQEAANYGARLMKQGGAIGVVLSPRDKDAEIDEEAVKKKLTTRTSGDRQHEPLVLSGAIAIDKLAFSPEEMALDTLTIQPISLVLACMLTPKGCLGLALGPHDATYANKEQEWEQLWEGKLIPTARIIAEQLNEQLLSDFGPTDRLSVAFDHSQVRALQEDQDNLFKRANDAWKLNAIDRATWKRMVGMKPLPEDKGVFYRDVAGGPQFPDTTGTGTGQAGSKSAKNGNGNGAKPASWAERVENELAALHAESE